MKFKVSNHSNLDMDQARPFLKSFLPFAKKKMGFDRPVSVIFKSDADNAAQPLGKTAFYDPNRDSITVYTDGRHLKDILRSLSHELVHHTQNCRGDLDQASGYGEDYFQKDKYMQEMEREAYEKGNMTFRDWEEKHKKQLKESNYYTGVQKMKRIDSRRGNLNALLMEKFGYKYNEAHCSEELDEAHCSEEELEEGGAAARVGNEDRDDGKDRMSADRIREEAKPDFLDLDKDGDKKEPMKKAAKEAGSKDDSEDEDEDTNEAMIREAVRRALRGV